MIKDNQEYRKQLISRAFTLAREVMGLTDLFPNKRSAWVITDQLIRAVTSIGANIIEAQSASSKRDFINFLNHSLKSGNETKFWLALSKDLDGKLVEKINKLVDETDQLVKMLGSSLLTLRGKKF